MSAPRYVPIRAGSGDDDMFDRPTISVTVPDDAPVKTGLLNADGVPLYRVRETVPIGFRGRSWT